MAAHETITFPLIPPFDEASALAQFVKRIDYETCVLQGQARRGRIRTPMTFERPVGNLIGRPPDSRNIALASPSTFAQATRSAANHNAVPWSPAACRTSARA